LRIDVIAPLDAQFQRALQLFGPVAC